MIDVLSQNLAAPDPVVNRFASGDRVTVTVHDWMTGEHRLVGTVRRIEANGRVIVDVSAGTQAMRLSCDPADVTAVG